MSLPPNWDLAYDDTVEKWFYVHKPTGATQFTFPKPGDELKSSAPAPEAQGKETLSPLSSETQTAGQQHSYHVNSNPSCGAPQNDSALAPHTLQTSQPPQQQWPIGVPGSSPASPATAQSPQQPVAQQCWQRPTSVQSGNMQPLIHPQQPQYQHGPHGAHPPSSQHEYHQAQQPQQPQQPQQLSLQTTSPTPSSPQGYGAIPQQQVYQQQPLQLGYPTPAATSQSYTQHQPPVQLTYPTPLQTNGDMHPPSQAYQPGSAQLPNQPQMNHQRQPSQSRNMQSAAPQQPAHSQQHQQQQLQTNGVQLIQQQPLESYQQPGYSHMTQATGQQQQIPAQALQQAPYRQQPLVQGQQQPHQQLPTHQADGSAPQYYHQLLPQNANLLPTQQQLQQQPQPQYPLVQQGQYIQQPAVAPVAPYPGQPRQASLGAPPTYYTPTIPQGAQPYMLTPTTQQGLPVYQQYSTQQPATALTPRSSYPIPPAYNQAQASPFPQQQSQQWPSTTILPPGNRKLLTGTVAGVVAGGMLLAKGVQKAVLPNQAARAARPARPHGAHHHSHHHQQHQGDSYTAGYDQDPAQQQPQYSYDPTQDPQLASSGGDGTGDGGGAFSSLVQSFTGGDGSDPSNGGYTDASGDYTAMLAEQQESAANMSDQLDVFQTFSDGLSSAMDMSAFC